MSTTTIWFDIETSHGTEHDEECDGSHEPFEYSITAGFSDGVETEPETVSHCLLYRIEDTVQDLVEQLDFDDEVARSVAIEVAGRVDGAPLGHTTHSVDIHT